MQIVVPVLSHKTASNLLISNKQGTFPNTEHDYATISLLRIANLYLHHNLNAFTIVYTASSYFIRFGDFVISVASWHVRSLQHRKNVTT